MSDIRTVRVDLAGRSYDIAIGPGLIDRAGELTAKLLAQPRVIIVSDDIVAERYGARLYSSFTKAGIEASILFVPAGERSKEFDIFGQLMNGLLDQRPDRQTTLVALGGGVVGDLVGFAASVLMRGVDFIQVPTTLLAQVDSSVGGKTAINTRHGKNLVGTFYQPRLVLADTDVLDTLPRRELLAGYAEVVKYGLIGDPAFFDWCEKNAADLLAGDAARRTYAIEQSCRAKARIVAADERETTDLRAAQSWPYLRPCAGSRDRLRAGPAARRGGRHRHGAGVRSVGQARPLPGGRCGARARPSRRGRPAGAAALDRWRQPAAVEYRQAHRTHARRQESPGGPSHLRSVARHRQGVRNAGR